jgi:proteasome lid subunit RPN8/RPN11
VIDEDVLIEVGESDQEMLPRVPMPWHHGVVPFGLPWDSQITVFIRYRVFRDISDHGKSGMDREIMGILLGQAYVCPLTEKKYVCIETAIPSKLAAGTSTNVVFDHDAWAEVLTIKEKDYPSLRVTGWYHTHPRMGVFFSPADEFCQKLAFTNRWQVGMTYDPARNSSGLFGWDENGGIALIDGFYELLDKDYTFSRIAGMGMNWDFKNVAVKKQTDKNRESRQRAASIAGAVRASNQQPHISPSRQALPPDSRHAKPALSYGAAGADRDTGKAALKWALVVVILMLLITIALVIGQALEIVIITFPGM